MMQYNSFSSNLLVKIHQEIKLNDILVFLILLSYIYDVSLIKN